MFFNDEKKNESIVHDWWTNEIKSQTCPALPIATS